jgi:molybdopterin molybdotransferase
MGLAASVGVANLRVRRRLRVAVLSTGDELVPPGRPLAPGQIYNSNRYTLLGLLAGMGCQVLDLGIVPDDLEATRRFLRKAAADADLILSSGGVSVGEEDHLRNAVTSEGSLALWRIRVKPGKPLAYGRVGTADFLGLPGNPVSTFVTFLLFVRPFILRRQGIEEVLPTWCRAVADFSWPRPGTRREFVRARLLEGHSGETRAQVFPRQGSDVLTSAVWGHGLVDIPEGTTVAPGQSVRYLPFAAVLE